MRESNKWIYVSCDQNLGTKNTCKGRHTLEFLGVRAYSEGSRVKKVEQQDSELFQNEPKQIDFFVQASWASKTPLSLK